MGWHLAAHSLGLSGRSRWTTIEELKSHCGDVHCPKCNGVLLAKKPKKSYAIKGVLKRVAPGFWKGYCPSCHQELHVYDKAR